MSIKRVVLAEYYTTDDMTLLFIIREDFDEPHVVEIKKPLKEIRQFVKEHFSEQIDKDGNVVKTTGQKVKSLDENAFQNFFELFVAPLMSLSTKGDLMTNEGDIIWFVPHDMLHYVPLHAIKAEGRYLIERNPVCYTPSASVMKYCQAKSKGRLEKALVLGDSRNDLIHAREQAQAVAELFNTKPYLNGQATKSLVKEKLEKEGSDIDILHFSCHGKFDPYEPLKSCIVLAPEKDIDKNSSVENDRKWNLTAEEIFGMEMHADLVTISTCESGINDRKPGDELIGLTRSLIYAGTPSVVVSLWSVDEISTSILMRKFYQALTGANKAEALQKAQIELMGLTAEDVIAYCKEAKENLIGPDALDAQRLLDRNIADMQYNARDFEEALNGYTRLCHGLNPDSKEYKHLTNMVSVCNLAKSTPKPIDYQIKLYTRPYHWASFILVGYWK